MRLDFSTPAPLPQNVPRGTFCHFSRWHNPKTRIAVLGFMIVIMFLVLTVHIDLNSVFIQSLEERMLYLNVSRGTILANPILGIGQGQFVADMQKFAPKPLESWQFQPVHNVYLIIWSELGIIGLALFLLFVYNMFQPVKSDFVPRGTKSANGPSVEHFNSLRGATSMEQASFKYLQAVLIGFLFLMFWDHYSWDIQQGQAALWIVFGFVTGIKGSQYQKKK